MNQVKTKERLLNAAEQLFAAGGFNGTSMRQLTQAANVNLAAVNYHFGSKDNLIREVLKRRLDDLYRIRAAELDALDERYGKQPPLHAVLRAFVDPALTIGAENQRSRTPFVQVLARAFVEYQGELRSFLSEHYGTVNRRFFTLIRAHLSHLPDAVAFTRIDFFIGALTYTLADFAGARVNSAADEGRYWLTKSQYLVDFAAAGLLAPHNPPPASP